MLYEMTVPPFIKTLKNLSALLDKGAHLAETKKFDVEVLLNSRLAPDQFPLTRQIQIACDTAKLGVARLTGKEAPSHPDTEKTLPELKARIESTIAFLESVSANDFAGSEKKHISQPRWEGKYLTGEDYVLHHAIPNIYFHVTTAYSILRHNGVEVGKKDFLGALPFKS
ncbi:DUF1993 domain-containing protein [Bdellovibrio bacteriovorus]|uniref:DUF1993 domain-containing protein n=1 Tax=Bdellovibrio bacteriovorus str. Tiberius TaxID=1069642 RepID=K7Z278_BDEBC|nr:DUF1993 domain-containing protein [Bdellovibrio bacteriovorus]AFY03215.1 hypothetical protein Bdt_3540 [Bdellovibrio bacteriovorus str. Tiberius]